MSDLGLAGFLSATRDRAGDGEVAVQYCTGPSGIDDERGERHERYVL
jgi:hypothetical protein